MTDFKQLQALESNPALATLLHNPAWQSSPLFQLMPDAFGPEAAVSLFWPSAP